MSDDTYYTLLNVKETASPSEIKTAYRDLIKQVHPDTITNLAPYLRRIAEDKAKEITEAYTVLSSSLKRREYDRQIAEYRRQNAPYTPPPTSQPTQKAASQASASHYCTTCGAQLHGGSCPNCQKFATSAGPLRQWAREHALLATVGLLIVLATANYFLNNETVQESESNCTPSDKIEVNGHFVCPTPVQTSQTAAVGATVTPTKANPPISKPALMTSTAPVSGTYAGTVHNHTTNRSSSLTVVIHQAQDGTLNGCVGVKPPLYGSGPLHGTVRGSRVSFAVADITFQGDASKGEIAGSYVVTRQEGNQLGEFHLVKPAWAQRSYNCVDGTLTDVKTAPLEAKPATKVPAGTFAIVTPRSGAGLYKRCAFLPLNNYARCNFGPEELAELVQGDRVRVLSPMTRAQSGDDIYKVRTVQGWEGWVRAKEIFIEAE